MFSAGLETNLKELKKTGVKALVIACFGVAVPLVGGALLYALFYGNEGPGNPSRNSGICPVQRYDPGSPGGRVERDYTGAVL